MNIQQNRLREVCTRNLSEMVWIFKEDGCDRIPKMIVERNAEDRRKQGKLRKYDQQKPHGKQKIVVEQKFLWNDRYVLYCRKALNKNNKVQIVKRRENAIIAYLSQESIPICDYDDDSR